MKTPFRKSEWFFMILGVLLIAASTYLLSTKISLLDLRPVAVGDPFQASYRKVEVPSTGAAAPAPTSAPSTGAIAPAPTSVPSAGNGMPAPTGTPILDSSGIPMVVKNKQKAYLLSPAAHAILTHRGNRTKGYSVAFKFEVDPKKTPCTFVLSYQGKPVISRDLKPSPTGSYQVSILIHQSGLYTWQIKTPESESELREVIIR